MEIEDATNGPVAGKLIRLIAALEKIANDHLKSKNLTPEDRVELEKASSEIKRAFRALTDEVLIPFGGGSPERLELAFGLVDWLLLTTVKIAGGATFTDSLASSLEKQQQLKQAQIGANARSKQAEEMRPHLFKAIKEEAKAQNLPLSKGIEFAGRVQPGVQKRLGVEVKIDSWPSPSLIKKTVSKPPEGV